MNFDTEKEKMNIVDFAYLIIDQGYYIGTDWHIKKPNGKTASRMARNGYYTIVKQINNTTMRFMEHRVIWVMINGSIDESKVINHINYDRADNNIKNLELVTQKENVQHSIEHLRENIAFGENNGKAILTNNDVFMIRYLADHGWKQSEIQKLVGANNRNLISRVVTGARYGRVVGNAEVLAIYPALVSKMRNYTLDKQGELLNYSMGLAGECGELINILKKHLFHDHELDKIHIIEELGDILFYIVAIAQVLEIDIEEIGWDNITKLEKRYPQGFDTDKSINREG